MSRTAKLLVLTGALTGLLALPGPARADHHLMVVNEVFLGLPGNTNAQFVEIMTTSRDQGFVDGHRIKLYNSTGQLQKTVTFAGDDEIGFPAGGSFLVATTAAETLLGIQADEEFTSVSGIDSGGAACFESTGGFDLVDCVSWGNFTNGNDLPGDPEGRPFNPSEGIPLGASIDRKAPGDEPVDSGDSRNDMRFGLVRPQNSAGNLANDLPRITISPSVVSVIESGGPAEFLARQSMGDAPNDYTADYSIDPQTATEGTGGIGDYEDETGTVTFESDTGDREESFSIAINDDTLHEGTEQARVKIRNPTGGAVLGRDINSILRILDPEDDSVSPKSRITRPKHRKTYRRSELRKIEGTSSDVAPGLVDYVGVGIRQKLKNGNCKWFNGNRFVIGPCNDGELVFINTTGNWRLNVAGELAKSVGTKVKFYTAYSQAVDRSGNVETGYQKGRNANKFEIK